MKMLRTISEREITILSRSDIVLNIYLMDAYEDVEDDIRSGNYNPFKDAFQNDKDFAEHCRQLLTLMMAECSREFEKMPILLHADILRNILYSGVWCRYTQVTNQRSGQN